MRSMTINHHRPRSGSRRTRRKAEKVEEDCTELATIEPITCLIRCSRVTRMALLPIVQLIHICDQATYDLNDDKWTQHHIWTTEVISEDAKFPFQQEECWVYIHLGGGLGTYSVAIEFFRIGTDEGHHWVGRSSAEQLEFTVDDRLFPSRTAIQFLNLPFRHKNEYEFRVVVEDENSDIHVLSGPDKTSGIR